MEYQITSWAGVNNVLDEKAPSFQGGESPAFVSAATDFVLTDDGQFLSRPGLEAVELTLSGAPHTLTSGVRLFEALGLTLLQDDSTLYSLDISTWALTELVSGLVGPVTLCEHADRIYYCDGTNKGSIESDGTHHNWGLALPPTPTLTGVSGSLPAGRYLVTVSLVDAQGIESGAPKAAALSVDGTKAIQASFGGALDSAATHAILYMSRTNSPILFYHSKVAVGDFPVTLTSEPTDSGQCWSLGLDPPPLGRVLFSFRDSVIVCNENYIFSSVGPAVHLFDYDLTAAVPETIIAGAGLDNGFWLVTDADLYWIEGLDPAQRRLTRKYTKTSYAAGTLVTNTSMLPFLGLEPQPVALFMSELGLVAGTQGQLFFPHRNRYHVAASAASGESVSFSYHVVDGVQLLLCRMDDKVICINTSSGAVTEFDLTLNGLVSDYSSLFALGSTTLYQVGEEEITPSFSTGQVNPVLREINIPVISLMASGTGNLTVSTITEERGDNLTNGPYYTTLSSYEDVVELTLEARQQARSYKFTFEGQIERFGDLVLELQSFVRRQ